MKKFFKKFSTYGFWVGLSGAIVVLLNAFGRAFGFSIENKIVEDCIMSVAGVLIVLGLVSKSSQKDQSSDVELENHKEDGKDDNE